jgi:hypothetical protein
MLHLVQGRSIDLVDVAGCSLATLILSQGTCFNDLVDMVGQALQLPSSLPITLKGLNACVLHTDSDCGQLADRDRILVSFCHLCLANAARNSSNSSQHRGGKLYTVAPCGHELCELCLHEVFDASRVPRHGLGHDLGLDVCTTYSLHCFPGEPSLPISPDVTAFNFLPQFVPSIRCPVGGCLCNIR